MKVLFLVNCSSFFCSHFLHLAIAVKNNGHEVAIAAGNNIQQEQIEKLGFSFYEVNLSRSGKNIFQELTSLISIYKLFKFLKPDLIHMFTIKPILYGCLIDRLFFTSYKHSIIASITGLGSASLSKGLFSRGLWFFLQKLYKYSLGTKRTKVIFENTDDKALFIKANIISSDKAYLVNGAGVNIEIFSPSSQKFKRFTVILVARLLKDKGIFEYIEAGKILKNRNVNIQLLLVGDIDVNNPSSLTEKDVSDAHYNNYINSLGYRTDIADLYKNSHVACLPSYREGLPKSLIEAASCGLPIVTTNVPGCRQIVEDGIGGFLVEPKDSIGLANALQKMTENKDMLQSMGTHNREVAEKYYSDKKVITSFFTIYGISIDMDINEKL